MSNVSSKVEEMFLVTKASNSFDSSLSAIGPENDDDKGDSCWNS